MTSILAYVGSSVAGFCVGAAVNVLADRVSDDECTYPPGSCPACGAALPAMRLVPLAGFWRASRRCPICGKCASLRAPAAGAVLAITYPLLLGRVLTSESSLHLPVAAVFLIEAVAAALLAFIFAVDLEHKLVLDVSVYPAILAILVIAALVDHRAFSSMLIGLALYGGLFLFLYGLGYLLYRTEALGLGDVKLAILIGLLVGWPAVTQALVLGAAFGAAVSLLLLGLGVAGRHTYIPYGIFMASGAVLALLLTTPYW